MPNLRAFQAGLLCKPLHDDRLHQVPGLRVVVPFKGICAARLALPQAVWRGVLVNAQQSADLTTPYAHAALAVPLLFFNRSEVCGGYQAVDYFSTYLDGNIRYSYFQYGVFSGTEDMSDGGNCCLGAEPCAIVVDAGQDASICVGDSVMLEGSGAVNYVWFPDVALSDDGIYNPYSTPETTITYILTGSDTDGCSGLDSVTVFVNPYPVVEIMDMGDGNLMATGGGSYQWYLNGAIIPGAINETYVATTTGYYAVEVTSDAGCTVLTEEIIVQVDPIANHYLYQQIICYPNPVNNELHITTKP